MTSVDQTAETSIYEAIYTGSHFIWACIYCIYLFIYSYIAAWLNMHELLQQDTGSHAFIHPSTNSQRNTPSSRLTVGQPHVGRKHKKQSYSQSGVQFGLNLICSWTVEENHIACGKHTCQHWVTCKLHRKRISAMIPAPGILWRDAAKM